MLGFVGTVEGQDIAGAKTEAPQGTGEEAIARGTYVEARQQIKPHGLHFAATLRAAPQFCADPALQAERTRLLPAERTDQASHPRLAFRAH